MAYPLSGTRRRSSSQARVGARRGQARRSLCTGSLGWRPSPRSRVQGRGPEEGLKCARECACEWECARMYAPGAPGPDCAAISPGAPLLSRSLLTFSLSHWLVNNKKEGGKRFPKKVDCKEAVGFRPLPAAGLCSALFFSFLAPPVQIGREGGRGSFLLLPRSCPSFSCQLSSHLSSG